LRFDYRYLPSENGMAVYRHFKKIAESLEVRFPGLAVKVEPPFVDSSAMDVPQDSTVVSAMRAVCVERGLPDTVLGVPYGSDATKMVNDGGIPTIVFGPGSIDQAHSLNEYVEIDQVVAAAEMLVALARRL
jgi:acetylornithine deacetylase